MPSKLKRPKAIVTDIEGTTTSIKYWGEALVPFIKYSVQKCLMERWDVPIVMTLIDNLRKSANEANKEGAGFPVIADQNKSKEFIIHSVVENVIHRMNMKKHGRALQHIQMYVWLYGYQLEELRGHVFEDVSKAFNSWHKFYNINIFTYSSGNYLTQKLLFAYSVKGNLTPLIKDYFDVESIGSKTESESYKTIAKEIGAKPEDILYLSDSSQELVAAKKAGYKVILVSRPYNTELSEEEKQNFDVIKSLEEIKFK